MIVVLSVVLLVALARECALLVADAATDGGLNLLFSLDVGVEVLLASFHAGVGGEEEFDAVRLVAEFGGDARVVRRDGVEFVEDLALDLGAQGAHGHLGPRLDLALPPPKRDREREREREARA